MMPTIPPTEPQDHTNRHPEGRAHRSQPEPRHPLGLGVLAALFGCLVLLFSLHARADETRHALAAPLPPPAGAAKLSTSVMTVTPELALPGGTTLAYVVEIRNTGAYTAEQVRFVNKLPLNTTYNGDAQSSTAPAPTFANGALRWSGPVGFDSVVAISFSLTLGSSFQGTLQNLATIADMLSGQVVTVTAQTLVTNQPIFRISKTAEPLIPGPNKPLTYALTVTNVGQPALNVPITVQDQLPLSTTLRSLGPDASVQAGMVSWNRAVTLATGQTSVFTFSVTVDDVPSGTRITNANYRVTGPLQQIATGIPHITKVIDPILSIYKYLTPDPPGANSQATYYLTVRNTGSLATGLVITDEVPLGVTYTRGGALANGVVSWLVPRLDTNQSTTVSFTVSIGDVAEVPLVNARYGVCSAEGTCRSGDVLDRTIRGPHFVVSAKLDPLTKKPGGGNSPVTPTLVLQNLGPGNALAARAILRFEKISVSSTALRAIPPGGTFTTGPACGTSCVSYYWTGNIASGQVITLTTNTGQGTQGGAEGNVYSTTVVLTDTLGQFQTAPVVATASGKVTHLANLLPSKSAPAIVGPGQLITYTLRVFNAGQAQDVPPYPTLTDTLPLSTTLVSISEGGITRTVGASTIISWTLPTIGTGGSLTRQFTVRASTVVSGTQLVNNDYRATWYNIGVGMLSNPGAPVTTTVQDVGLIHSFKTVTPELARPGPANVLTYTVHVVNSSALPLANVRVSDLLPWQHTTYLRDATASAGTVISDIVSVDWIGDVAPFSTELITMSVVVDPYYSGLITNTATITHPELLAPVVVEAVAYVADAPVLRITKTALPSPLWINQSDVLQYALELVNEGQPASNLVITDSLPINAAYLTGSATGNGDLVGQTLRWSLPTLEPGERRRLTFKVKVLGGSQVINKDYRVTSAEGAWATGPAVITQIYPLRVYLPAVYH